MKFHCFSHGPDCSADRRLSGTYAQGLETHCTTYMLQAHDPHSAPADGQVFHLRAAYGLAGALFIEFSIC